MNTPLLGISLLVSSEALNYLFWRNALSNRSAKITVIKGSKNPRKNGIERIIDNDISVGSTDLLRIPRIALSAALRVYERQTTFAFFIYTSINSDVLFTEINSR